MKFNQNINNLPVDNLSTPLQSQPETKDPTNLKKTQNANVSDFFFKMCKTYSEWEKTKEAQTIANSIKENPNFLKYKKNTVQTNSNQYAFKNIQPNLLFSDKLKIGSGGFGSVYYGRNAMDTEKYAIKMQNPQIFSDNIIKDNTFLQKLKSYQGFPKVYHYCSYKKSKVLVMDLLGPSMDKIFKFCDKSFQVNTVALLGEEMLNRIESMHVMGILHRDIKPNNFSFGKFDNIFNRKENMIYLFDFGLSCNFIVNDKHYEYTTNNGFVGTLRYASLNSHNGIRQSRRDDLESWLYVLLYFLRGKLPWEGIKAKSKKEKLEIVKKIKTSINPNVLFEELPEEFIKIYTYIKSLSFEANPSYFQIIWYLRKINAGLKVTDIWEWETKMLTDENLQKKQKFNTLFQGYSVEYETFISSLKDKYQIEKSKE